jgi:hypothetical protein
VKRQIIAIIVLLTLVLSIGDFAKADIVDNNGEVLAKAPYIQSPTNTTYGYNSLTLNVTFYADWYKEWDYSINYSLDGKANQTLTLELYTLGPYQHPKTYISAITIPIFNLSEGTHHLTVYLQLMATTTKNYYDSQTVVFTIATNHPTLTNSPTPSAPVPELSWLMILPLLLSVMFVPVTLRHRKTTNLIK